MRGSVAGCGLLDLTAGLNPMGHVNFQRLFQRFFQRSGWILPAADVRRPAILVKGEKHEDQTIVCCIGPWFRISDYTSGRSDSRGSGRSDVVDRRSFQIPGRIRVRLCLEDRRSYPGDIDLPRRVRRIALDGFCGALPLLPKTGVTEKRDSREVLV